MPSTRMTRQHFEAVAAAVRTTDAANAEMVLYKAALAARLASELRNFNDQFNYERFVKACLSEGDARLILALKSLET